LLSLGVGRLVPVTVIGDDGHGFDLMNCLQHESIDRSLVIRDQHRLTPTYTKPMRQNESGEWVELNRLDVRDRCELSEATRRAIAENIGRMVSDVDGVIVLDQINEPDWGVVHGDVRGELRRLSKQQPDLLIYSDSRNQIHEFDFGVVKANRDEVTRATDGRTLEESLAEVARKTGRVVFCTCGEDGILVTDPEGRQERSATVAATGPIDIVGAGDAASSGIVATLLSGGAAIDAAEVGNLTASITIEQLGCTGVATPDQIRLRNRAP
ncbi:MAG: PfkB family carbohydrate kinase, partial [Pirellulaceae bacterium]|nr:PfkB family carbohydrate kinase [Pirellulaceae bacterium]